MATPIALPSIYKSITAPAGANPQDVQSVQDQMAMQFAPQENSITNTINTLQGYLDRDINTQQQFGQIADQKIADVGSQLAGQLQGNVGAIGDIYGKGVQQVGGIYDQAAQATQAAGTSIRDRLTSSANQLGQGQALKADAYGTDPISRLLAQQASAETRIASGKAGSQTNLATLGTQLQGIAQKAVGDSEREYAQKRTDVATQVLKVIGQLQMNTNEGVMQQLQKFSTLAEVAGPTFRTLLSQATSSRNAATRQAGLDAFKQAMDMADLGIKQQNANTSAAKAFKEDDPNSLDNIIKMQTIEKNNQALDPSLTYKSDAEGNAAFMDLLSQATRKDRKSPGLSGPQNAGIKNFINQNMGMASMTGLYNTTDPVKILASIAQQNLDPKTGLVKLPVTSGSKYKQEDYQVDMQTLLEMLQARFTNVGTSAKVGAKIK